MTLAALLGGDPVAVAPRLLGRVLRTRIGGETTAIRITETEAYREDDPASHSYRGRTKRNLTMFGRPGLLYVYRSYGVHWCSNVVVGPEGWGAAVLIRGGDPIEGVETMQQRRGRSDHLTDGPGKVCAALGITGDHDGTDLLDPDSSVHLAWAPGLKEFSAVPRVGISKATERPWRFIATS